MKMYVDRAMKKKTQLKKFIELIQFDLIQS